MSKLIDEAVSRLVQQDKKIKKANEMAKLAERIETAANQKAADIVFEQLQKSCVKFRK